MELRITNIDENIGTAEYGDVTQGQEIQLQPNGELRTVLYKSDQATDSVEQVVYSRSQPCQFDLDLVIIPEGPGTCGTTPDFAYTIRIDGTYSCDELKSEEGAKVIIEQGAFYCEVAKVDACPPGGGGGGGLAPIPK